MAQLKNVPVVGKNGQTTYYNGDESGLEAYKSQVGGSAGSLPTLPPAGAPPTPSLPQRGGNSSALLTFADSLDAAVNLARKNRNQSSLEMMAPFQGTAMASDFNSILGNLNAASDKTSEKLIKKVTDVTNREIVTATDDSGTVRGIDRNTGQVVWTAPGVGNRDNGSGASSDNVKKLKDALAASKFEGPEADGKYADPRLYQQNYEAWVSVGNPESEFFKLFPPQTYINPKNTWLPESIMKYTKASGDDLFDNL